MMWIWRRWSALRAGGAQRGAVTTIGAAIWFPLIIVVVLVMAVGYNTWSYGHELVQGAAEIGAQQAGLSPASADRGRAAAQQFLAEHGSDSVTDVQVQVDIAGGVATVRVFGHAKGMMSGAVPAIAGQAAAAVEPAP